MARGCFSSEVAVGCTGMLFGAALTIGAQVYATMKIAEKVSAIYKTQRALGPSQETYDQMCASGAWRNDRALKATCEEMKRALDAKKGGATQNRPDTQNPRPRRHE